MVLQLFDCDKASAFIERVWVIDNGFEEYMAVHRMIDPYRGEESEKFAQYLIVQCGPIASLLGISPRGLVELYIEIKQVVGIKQDGTELVFALRNLLLVKRDQKV